MAEVAPSIRGRGCGACRGKTWTAQCRPCRERRGDFKAISIGVSYGGGQTVSVSPLPHLTWLLKHLRPPEHSITIPATNRGLHDY